MAPDHPEHNQQQSRFLSLPPEIRDIIYRLVFVKETSISPQRASHREEERSILPMFQACRRVRQETAEVYFGNNTFRFFDDGELHESELPLFFQCLGSENLKLCAAISLESSLGLQLNRRCFTKYCVGSIEIACNCNTRTAMATTAGRTNCCGEKSDELERACEKVQAVLSRVGDIAALGAKERASLGSEVGIEFCATFEHLHPDYGD